MPLDVPDLDDRSYEDLLEDARKRIPVHAEEWTDHNAHDPGITLLELLAWLAESYTYQLDRIGDEHRRKYLGLVDVEPEPPRPATVTVALDVPRQDAPPADLDEPADLDRLDGETVEPGTELVAETPGNRRERFRTTGTVALSSAQVAAVVVEHDGRRTDHTRANDGEDLHYPAFGQDPSTGDALYLGFDANPFASPRLDLWVDYHDADLPAPASHGDEPVGFEPSMRCVWEHCIDPDRWYLDRAWAPVPVETDETNALHTGGRVTVTRPDGWRGAAESVAEHDQPRYWLRCRLAPLEPEPVPEGPCEPSAPEGPPEPRYEVPPRINAVAVNVVRASHSEPVADERLRTPDGDDTTSAAPNQRFDLDRAPVQDADIRVGGTPWTAVDDFDASTPDDRHYTLDRQAGTVTFGDGRRGAIPEPGQPVRADYEAGGGPAGNLPADAAWRFVSTSLERVEVVPRAPPSGGTDAESIEAALARAREQRRVPYRAVTAGDHAAIATHTPGLRFGRAAVVAAPGGTEPVRVVVVPYSPDGRLPVPSEGFRAAVEAHLCEHALLTERVQVVGPTFVPVGVRVEVAPVEGADRQAVRLEARERLGDFLDPLDGFDGGGWPFGRPVYRSELYEQLERLPLVADAVDVGVTDLGAVAMGDRDDTLPDLTGLDIELVAADDRCGRHG